MSRATGGQAGHAGLAEPPAAARSDDPTADRMRRGPVLRHFRWATGTAVTTAAATRDDAHDARRTGDR